VILAYLLPVAVAESFAEGSLRGDVIFPTDSHGYWMVDGQHPIDSAFQLHKDLVENSQDT
jgi:hypothetical protein